MRFPVRFPALVMVAGAFTFAACGGETAESPVNADAVMVGPLEYVVSPNLVEWTSTPGADVPANSQTVLIAGLIAAGGYPSFGAPQYSGGAGGWYEMSTTPDFSRSPLGWRFTFRLRPSVRNLPAGVYTAQIPVNVPAARNNPQMITVRLNLRRNIPVQGDLVTGAQLPVVLTETTTRFNPTDPTEDPNGAKRALAFRMVLQPGQSTYIRHTANFDAYIYVWEEPATSSSFVTSNDDSCSSLNSQVFVQNTSGAPKTYLVYGSHFGGLRTGSGTIFLTGTSCGSAVVVLRGEPSPADLTLEAAMRAEYNAKYGIKE